MAERGRPASPLIVVLSGPGGAGKGTIARMLVEADGSLRLSRSWTSRERRADAPDDAYVFVDRAAFEVRRADDGFIEWNLFLGCYYGTPVPDPADDRVLLLEIDVAGGRQVLDRHADALCVFVDAPSDAELYRRLVGRGDGADRAASRISEAARERVEAARIGYRMLVNDAIETGQSGQEIAPGATAAECAGPAGHGVEVSATASGSVVGRQTASSGCTSAPLEAARYPRPRGASRSTVQRYETMVNPPIEDLLDLADSKFRLVTVSAKRARQINSYFGQLGEGLGSSIPPQVTSTAVKPLSIAFEELAAEKIVPIEPPDEPEVDPEAESADGDAGGYDEAAGSPAGESA